MSGKAKDFYTICVECRGVDCDIDARCIECTDVDNAFMSDYIRYKLSLRRKLKSKRKLLKSADLPVDSVPNEAFGIELP